MNINIRIDILHILQTLMEQNYSQFYQKHYKQTDGLAMGTPTLSVWAETYIQHMQHKKYIQS
jgi:hypothetical protein